MFAWAVIIKNEYNYAVVEVYIYFIAKMAILQCKTTK